MTLYEQLTITGDIEIIDGITCEVRARRLTLTCERACRLYYEAFMEGEDIEVTFPASCDLDAGRGAGPWEPGGYSSRWIRYHALEIIECSRDKILFNRQTYAGEGPSPSSIIEAEKIGSPVKRSRGPSGQLYRLAGNSP